MQLTPVESTHIAAIGYLEAERVLLVRYKDGSVYAWDDIGATAWNILASPVTSKGLWMSALSKVRNGTLIAKGVMPTDTDSSPVRPGSSVPERSNDGTAVTEPGDNAAPSPGLLNVIDEDACKCCRRSLAATFARWPNVTITSCGDCGTEFVLDMAADSVRYWRIKAAFGVHRRGQ